MRKPEQTRIRPFPFEDSSLELDLETTDISVPSLEISLHLEKLDPAWSKSAYELVGSVLVSPPISHLYELSPQARVELVGHAALSGRKHGERSRKKHRSKRRRGGTKRLLVKAAIILFVALVGVQSFHWVPRL